MNNIEFKAARKELGLTQAGLSQVMDTDAQSIRRIEMDASASTSRTPAPRMARLLRAYLSGYRPSDWP